MTAVLFPRLFRPGAVITVATQVVTSLDLPPPLDRGQGLRAAFRVKRTLTSSPDEGEVSIFGLAPERRAAMYWLFSETGGAGGVAKLTIAAGYEGVTPLIFAGDVRTMEANKRSGDSDYALIASADDGGDVFSDITVSYSTARWSAKNMIDVALAAFNAGDPIRGVVPYPIAPHPSVAAVLAAAGHRATAQFGGAHVGKASQLLDEAARILGVRWWFRDGQLFMAARRIPVDTLAVVLDRRKWLAEPSEDGSGLMRLTTMFDPNIVPGRQVTLVGRVVPGVPEQYRCEACEHTGDTRGGRPWATSMHLRSFP